MYKIRTPICQTSTLEEVSRWLSSTHQQVKFTVVTKAVKPVAVSILVRMPATGFHRMKGSLAAKTAVKTDS